MNAGNNVLTLFSDDAIFEQLSKTDASEAYVLLGTALQKKKKHRDAIRVYEKVASNSRHFRIAQLNLASAFLRQEWWTDAHAAIHAALKENANKRDGLDYRLFTMLGYSQIQFGFYRDARESFRNVAVSSIYAQRALLGLGIAALHQQDFIGALNAFDKLRGLQKPDMSTAEAYLLSAFALRQLEQFDAATSRYQEAIDYYQTLSSQIAAQLESTDGVAIGFLRTEHSADKRLLNNARKIALLEGLSKAGASNEAAGINILKSKLNNDSAERTRQLLREEKTAIDSYLSQSRFGLASLYDHK
jgi:tetratricopeptide (TPR) repeat protein